VTTNLLIERATEDEYAGILEIDAAVMGDYGRAGVITEALARRELFIAREGWEPIGYAIFNRSFFGQYFIELLIVHPDHRRRGIASGLMLHLETICPASRLFTSTNESNLPMQRLCEKRGYARSGYIENLDEGDPEIIYVKFLEK
jgi:GNAT superfamily N-acetyltransferase